MNETELMEVDQMECDVCGERRFQEREGFYYCNECGTKKEHVRAVEISAEDTFNDTTKHTTQRTIKKPKIKAEENDITSWEFYNYVLKGFLQELIHMGAKPELKLMTLQVWAAYMGRMEVAFCKNNEVGLPKLNVRALQSDARIIYNHKKNKRKRDRQIKKAPQQLEDERSNWREWRKTKRKLDRSDFTERKGAVSESTLHSNQSIKLQWSANARRSLKQQMSLKHLDKHSLDSSGSMHCHRLHPKASTLNHFDRNIYCLNITKLYVVLAIALNLVEDDIKLTDLLRFVDEEHLTSRHMLRYLPDNVAMQGKAALLKQMEFGHQMDKCRYKFMRMNIAQMSRFIDLNGFQNPDLRALAERYVLELNLPSELASYVCCLMDALPPAFEPTRGQHVYPRYEARAMAYIIYCLKLLFGLDDVKERAISDSAMSINEHLLEIADVHQMPMAPLFVYTEWMQFVEMRTVLVGHYSESFARRFGVSTQNGRKVNDFLSKERKQREQEYNCNDVLLTPAMQRMRENFSLIFETLLRKEFGDSSKDTAAKDLIEFQPSLTPAHSYFKRILLHAAQAQQGEMSVNIPDCMHVDHTDRQLAPFKNHTTELSQYLSVGKQQLRVEELACQTDYQQVGIFQGLSRLNSANSLKEFRANCDVTTQSWVEELRRREKRPDFVFRQPVALYGKIYQNTIKNRAGRRQALEKDNPFWKIIAGPTYALKLNDEEVLLNNLTAMQTFDERSMDPMRVPLNIPRRPSGLLSETEATQSVQPKLENSSAQHVEKTSELLLKVSNFDCWLLHGYTKKMRESDKQKLRSLFPCSFRWLLDTCAATIGVDWDVLYEQLLVLEVMFHHGIEDWKNHSNHLRLKYNILNKDINMLTKTFRDMW